jgi:hypothetical protein
MLSTFKAAYSGRDGPAGGYYIYEIASLLAPKARHSYQSLGQRPRVMRIKKILALKARFTFGTPVGSAPIESRFQRLFAWRFEFLGRCPRLDFEIAPMALPAATGFLKSL